MKGAYAALPRYVADVDRVMDLETRLDSSAFTACSIMPRFGRKRILTETQLAHLVALLLDPASPVSR